MKQKAFLIIFKELSVVRIYLTLENESYFLLS